MKKFNMSEELFREAYEWSREGITDIVVDATDDYELVDTLVKYVEERKDWVELTAIISSGFFTTNSIGEYIFNMPSIGKVHEFDLSKVMVYGELVVNVHTEATDDTDMGYFAETHVRTYRTGRY